MKFFFNLPHFLLIIINIVIVCEIVTKIVINIKIGINKNSILNINKSGFLTITIVLINDNNIK